MTEQKTDMNAAPDLTRPTAPEMDDATLASDTQLSEQALGRVVGGIDQTKYQTGTHGAGGGGGAG
jgi:hypothetical protein